MPLYEYMYLCVRVYACIHHIYFRNSKCQVRSIVNEHAKIVNFLTHSIIYTDTHSAGKVTRRVNQLTNQSTKKKRKKQARDSKWNC